MTLESAIQFAAKNLPELWEVEISIQRSSGEVRLYDADGDAIATGPVDNNESFGECVARLVLVANPKAKA